MKRPKISRRAETRPYGRVSAPTGNCRKFLTQLENETFNTLKNAQYLEHNFGHGTQPPVGYFRCADAAGVPDRPAAGNGLPRHEANLRQVLYPNHNVGTSAQQFLCGSLPQLAGNCTATPSGSTPRTSPTIRPDGRPPLQLLDEEDRDVPRPHAALTVKRPAYRFPEPVPTHDDMPCKPSENVGFPYRNMKRPTSSPK